jgi:two-component system response regulator ChvI
MVDITQEVRSPLNNEAALLVTGRSTEVIRILLIDTASFSHGGLAQKLSSQGFEVCKPDEGNPVAGAPDMDVDAAVIVVGGNRIGTPTSGIDILASLRRQGANIPLLFVASHVASVDDFRFVGNRASDFAVPSEARLVERLRNVIQAFKNTGAFGRAGVMDCGHLRLCSDISRAYWRDVDLDLTVREYRIVQLLASHAGRTLSYRAIYDSVHYEGFIAGSGPEGYRANVRSTVKRIRHKFLTRDQSFDAIFNAPRYGYGWREQ